MGGGRSLAEHHKDELIRIEPHARTIRKAREQVKLMVFDGISTQRIRNYLHRWCLWWVRTSDFWAYSELLKEFMNSCWDVSHAAIAAGLLRKQAISLSRYRNLSVALNSIVVL